MKIRLAHGATLTTVEGKDVLFSVRSGESYGLNETAARMLRLGLETDLSQAAATMAADYGIGREDILADLEQLVQHLIQLAMVEPLSDQGG